MTTLPPQSHLSSKPSFFSILIYYQSCPRRHHHHLFLGNQRTTAAMDADAVAKAFVSHYYTTFDTDRANLTNLYQETSMLSFEGQKFQGTQNITSKLTSLPFQQCQHQISTVDCQTSGPVGGVLVFVSGNLQIGGEQHPLKFSQHVSSDANSSRKLLCA
ncbi:Nuclear transport factor 2A [Castilleja foliolosa]|uniref:Nuclear transport factor 2A n=1 Tax=Castilleja foliolosa TaxID=1961234 RepID=A0ABD3B8C1_9LAMI